MGPGVEYILRARDLLSGVLKNASKAAENVSKSVDGVGKSTEKAMAQAEKSVSRASQSWKNYIDNVRQSNTETNNLASGIGRVVGAMAVFQGLKTVFELGANMEQNKIGFEVLLGSAQKARIMLAQIIDYANTNQYENVGLIKNAKTLLAFGTSAEKILPSIKMLGDIAMGDTQRLESLTLAYAQMTAAGKLQGQDLLQMVNAGFNPLQELHLMTGKSLKYYRDQMEKGAISTGMIEAAFQHATSKGGKFYDMMNRMSETTTGKYQIMTGTFKQTVATIGEGLLPTANRFLEVGIKITNWIGNNINLVVQLTAVVLGAVAAFQLVTGAIKLWTIAQAILNGTMALNPVGLIIIGIAALIAMIVIAWNKFSWFRGGVMGLWETFKLFGNFLKDAVMNTVKGLVDMFVGLGTVIGGIFNRDWGKIKSGAKQAAGGWANSFGGGGLVKAAIDNGSKVGETWAKGYNKGIKSFANSQASKKSSLDAGSLTSGLGGGGTGGLNPDDKIKSIAGGGSKPTNIYVNLNKEMVGQITIHANNVSEGADEMKTKVMEALSQILNSANRLATE